MISRLSIGSGNARDLVQLRGALLQLPGLRSLIAEVQQASDPVAPSLSEDVFEEETDNDLPPLLSQLGGNCTSCRRWPTWFRGPSPTTRRWR